MSASEFTVRVFGPQAEMLGCRELTVRIHSTAITASDLLSRIGETHPELEASLPVSRIAVDHRYAEPDELIEAGSELALIGLISGG